MVFQGLRVGSPEVQSHLPLFDLSNCKPDHAMPNVVVTSRCQYMYVGTLERAKKNVGLSDETREVVTFGHLLATTFTAV